TQRTNRPRLPRAPPRFLLAPLALLLSRLVQACLALAACLRGLLTLLLSTGKCGRASSMTMVANMRIGQWR
ncbi:hypothetical protein BC834DRAFT_907009, partial [Gloeopeniophorella convolvens]